MSADASKRGNTTEIFWETEAYGRNLRLTLVQLRRLVVGHPGFGLRKRAVIQNARKMDLIVKTNRTASCGHGCCRNASYLTSNESNHRSHGFEKYEKITE
jgi:hypothetical protein